MSVWDTLVGQKPVITALQEAVSGHGMTQSWLFTGPPGSGRSNAAIAFAAALQCDTGGCGECHACRTVLAGNHADVEVVRTQKLSLGVEDVRELVRSAALAPVGRGWQILIVEDADRLTEQANNALLKAIEEPNHRTVWMLCAPTVEDLLPTIRSRCRLVTLTTPSVPEVSDFLVRTMSVPRALADHAARASQGHIGRAKALAGDERIRNRRREVTSYPLKLTSVGAALRTAQQFVEATKEEADELTVELDAVEKAELDQTYGVEAGVRGGRRPREYGPALARLEKDQKTRAKRRHLDVIDRGLMDLVTVYRDAIALSAGSNGHGGLVNEELREELPRLGAPEANLRRVSAVFTAREQLLEFNVTPALALEAMMLALRDRGERSDPA